MINYNGKKFTPLSNTPNGEVEETTIFNYHQEGNMVWAEYEGATIKKGFLIGVVNEDSSLDFHYQHLNKELETRIGKCHTIPKLMDDGKLEMHETWQWLNGDQSEGKSVLKEV